MKNMCKIKFTVYLSHKSTKRLARPCMKHFSKISGRLEGNGYQIGWTNVLETPPFIGVQGNGGHICATDTTFLAQFIPPGQKVIPMEFQ